VKLLVTGGAGFIGSNFIRHWARHHTDDRIIDLDLLTYAGDPRSLQDVDRERPETHRLIVGDIADRTLVRDLVCSEQPDVIVNFAAESHNSRALLDPGAFVRTNVVGTQVLLDAAREAKTARVHHISTCEVYGDLALDSSDRFDETSPYRPRTPYNASKAAADLMVRAYGDTFGLPYTISNSCNNYGPYQHPEKVIPLFTTNALEGEPLPLYRHSENRREWVHVQDHCRAIESIILRGKVGETYNVGTGDERSIEEVADLVLAATGRTAELKRYVPDRPGHDRRYLLDHTKIEVELGWRPEVMFEEGLRETVRWYAEHQDWWRPKKARASAELDERAWGKIEVR
jgi:dTDP-glucose 4,6-dehydratase